MIFWQSGIKVIECLFYFVSCTHVWFLSPIEQITLGNFSPKGGQKAVSIECWSCLEQLELLLEAILSVSKEELRRVKPIKSILQGNFSPIFQDRIFLSSNPSFFLVAYSYDLHSVVSSQQIAPGQEETKSTRVGIYISVVIAVEFHSEAGKIQ